MLKSNFPLSSSMLWRNPCCRFRACSTPPQLMNKAAWLQQPPSYPAPTSASVLVQSNVQLECPPDFIYLGYACLINTVHTKQMRRERERDCGEKELRDREKCYLFSDSIFNSLILEKQAATRSPLQFNSLQLLWTVKSISQEFREKEQGGRD